MVLDLTLRLEDFWLNINNTLLDLAAHCYVDPRYHKLRIEKALEVARSTHARSILSIQASLTETSPYM